MKGKQMGLLVFMIAILLVAPATVASQVNHEPRRCTP